MIGSGEIKEMLLDRFSGAIVTVSSDDNIHFSVEVLWGGFKGLSRVKQHQLVNSVLSSYISSGELHALALKTRYIGK